MRLPLSLALPFPLPCTRHETNSVDFSCSSGMENDETLARLLMSGTVKKIEDHKDP